MHLRTHPTRTRRRSLAATGLPLLTALAALALAGCASDAFREAEPGQSQRQAIAQQSVRPPGSPLPSGPLTLDGVAAAHAVDRYHQSFQRPPAPVNVLNLLTSPGAAAPAAGMPAR